MLALGAAGAPPPPPPLSAGPLWDAGRRLQDWAMGRPPKAIIPGITRAHGATLAPTVAPFLSPRPPAPSPRHPRSTPCRSARSCGIGCNGRTPRPGRTDEPRHLRAKPPSLRARLKDLALAAWDRAYQSQWAARATVPDTMAAAHATFTPPPPALTPSRTCPRSGLAPERGVNYFPVGAVAAASLTPSSTHASLTPPSTPPRRKAPA